jgi:hypothetical protein
VTRNDFRPRDLSGFRRILRLYREELPDVSPDIVLSLIREELDAYDKRGARRRNPKSLARRLLLFYKIGGALSAEEGVSIPFSIRHCFDYRDADVILRNDPTLLPRLHLCYLDTLDIEQRELSIAYEFLERLKDHVFAERARNYDNRGSVAQMIPLLSCAKDRGPLRPERPGLGPTVF